MNRRKLVWSAMLIAVALWLASLWAGLRGAVREPLATPPLRMPPLEAAKDVPMTVVAVGDLCGEGCERTAALVAALRPTVFLALGDLAYENGSRRDFERRYDPHFGRFQSITRPTPGNHEYRTAGAEGYFDYFNGAGQRVGVAGDRDQGYYSFDVGGWHLISLNSTLKASASSPQVAWLRRDLVGHHQPCTLAYWHHPRFSAGHYRDEPAVAVLYRTLVEHGADVVLAGHDHNYQRFAKLDADGSPDPDGIRSWVVGTGGRHLDRLRPDSRREAAQDEALGVLQLELLPTGYRWRYVVEGGGAFADSGEDSCRRAG